MKKFYLTLALFTSILSFGQQRDSLHICITKYRYNIYNFIVHSKLEPESVHKEVLECLDFLPTADEIILKAYAPNSSFEEFRESLNRGCDPLLEVVNTLLDDYRREDKKDTALYSKKLKLARDSFEINLKEENQEWYNFYIIRKGKTDDIKKDVDMLHDIMIGKSFQSYMNALNDAQREYLAPNLKSHQDLKELRSSIQLYRTAAARLFVTYRNRSR